MKYYLEIESDHEWIEQTGGCNGPYSGYNHDAYVNHRFKLTKDKVQYPDQTIETDLKNPYIVVVVYGDGGTFGRTDGHTQYVGCFGKKTAEKVCELIDNSKYDELKKIVGENFYPYWDGYFASFEKVVMVGVSSKSKWEV